MNRVIRHRLLTIVMLGVLTSALSVLSLVQLLTTSTAQRVERARDVVVEEVGRLARAPGDLEGPAPSTLVGLRAGVAREDAAPRVDPAWAEVVGQAIAGARAAHARHVSEVTTPRGELVVAAEPAADGRGDIVWAAFLVRPLASLRTWQRIVALLAAATVLLVATSLYSVVTVSRGAAALRGSLDALATDLRASVPRPEVRELDGIADGIAGLARKLADARAEEARLARELSLQERLAGLGRVVAGVAHEVRNPLASIKLRLDLAASAGAMPPAAEAAIAHATSEIERLDRLVRDLLFVAGRSLGPKGRRDVGALARERAAALEPWAEERGVAIAVRGEPSVEASLDADAMARAIDNLVRNAVEASPHGGTVDVFVDGGADARSVVVRVEDDGVGVAPARSGELFEPFFTTKPSGTGLGLAISRAIARAHEGDLTYSRVGARTRFALTVSRTTGGKEAT